MMMDGVLSGEVVIHKTRDRLRGNVLLSRDEFFRLCFEYPLHHGKQIV
jgi:hypothetical protein